MSTGTRPARPAGRRPGDSGTRQAILDAALALFAERGYDGASIRAIAARAEVDPALVRHFFTDKETLLAVALASRTPIAQRIAERLPGDRDTLGLRLADTYFCLWEDPRTQPLLLALAKSAMTSDRAAATLPQALMGIARTALPDLDEAGHAGLMLAVSHLFGTAVARYILRVPSLTAPTRQELAATIGPVIQRYL
jgi:AcrR family transcriptional regulator